MHSLGALKQMTQVSSSKRPSGSDGGPKALAGSATKRDKDWRSGHCHLSRWNGLCRNLQSAWGSVLLASASTLVAASGKRKPKTNDRDVTNIEKATTELCGLTSNPKNDCILPVLS
jgi:hypothetical protein